MMRSLLPVRPIKLDTSDKLLILLTIILMVLIVYEAWMEGYL